MAARLCSACRGGKRGKSTFLAYLCVTRCSHVATASGRTLHSALCGRRGEQLYLAMVDGVRSLGRRYCAAAVSPAARRTTAGAGQATPACCALDL